MEGPNPVRVVLDPDLRLGRDYSVFTEGPETLVICADDTQATPPPGQTRVLRVPRGPGGLDVRAIIGVLATCGLRRLFVEGGGVTVSRFLTAGALDRMHVTVAPLLMGAGIPAFSVPPVTALPESRRFNWTTHTLGKDVLLDIPLIRA